MTTETIVINGTKQAAEAIRNEIDAQPGSQSQLTERKNLDGSAAAWIVIATSWRAGVAASPWVR
jgi:hypothetical protein